MDNGVAEGIKVAVADIVGDVDKTGVGMIIVAVEMY